MLQLAERCYNASCSWEGPRRTDHAPMIWLLGGKDAMYKISDVLSTRGRHAKATSNSITICYPTLCGLTRESNTPHRHVPVSFNSPNALYYDRASIFRWLQLAQCYRLRKKINILVCCNSPSAVNYNRISIFWCAATRRMLWITIENPYYRVLQLVECCKLQ